MKITNLTLTLFKWGSAAWRTHNTNFGGERRMGVIAIETDTGVQGHSFLGSSRHNADVFAGPLMDTLKPLLIGRDPLEIGAHWTRMWPHKKAMLPRVIGAVDVALWDLAGKVAGLPIHQMLGSCRHEVRAYASSGWMATPQEYVDEALAMRAQGLSAYKIHPHTVPHEDIEICRAVRKAVGDGMVLMLDAQWGYRYEEAVKVGKAIQELDFLWYEDPLAEEDIHGYVKLHQKLDIPIMATEYVPGGFHGMAEWVVRGATDMLRGDVAVTGGLTPLMKAAHLADAFRMRFEIHHGGNSLNNVANLHATMAIDNCDYFELFPVSVGDHYGLITDIEADKRGMIPAPGKPGLGYEIDWDLVKRDTVQVIK